MPSTEFGLGEIVDHRHRRRGVGLVERLLDLVVERALADRERRGRMACDRARERLGFGERAALGNHAVDEAEALGLAGAVERCRSAPSRARACATPTRPTATSGVEQKRP